MRKGVKWGPRGPWEGGRGEGRTGPSEGLEMIAVSNSGHCSYYLKGVGLGSVI